MLEGNLLFRNSNLVKLKTDRKRKAFPKQSFFTVRTLWISEERELVHEIAGLGELQEPWHSSQMSWLENHLSLINTYTTALENLDNYRGIVDS